MNALTRMTGFALAAIVPAALFAQSSDVLPAIDQFARLQDELRSSRADGNTAAYVAASQTMYLFLNGSPRATLQLVSAESSAGNLKGALRSFAQFVAMGQADEEVLKAKSFDPLRVSPKFKAVHAAMTANTASRSVAHEVFRLESTARIPEDIDYDPSAKFFYISTVLGKQILQVDLYGKAKLFARSPDNWPMMALKIDPRRRVLWATEVALDGFAGVAKEDWGRSAILLYDLSSGTLLHRIEGPPKAALGDMALDANGNAIVSDGVHGGLYRISGDAHGIDRIDAGDFVSPQTPAVLPDGKHILVPDYLRGIGVLDLNTRHVQWIAMRGQHALSGIDGLYCLGHVLIATQNGTSPERVIRFVVSASMTRVLSESILESATATLGDPTHGVIVGEDFYYIANSGWELLDEHGVLKQGASPSAPIIMRVSIGYPT